MPAVRLCDIGPNEMLRIECHCRRIVVFNSRRIGQLGVPAETAIADIVPRLRCENCGAREGFRVTIEYDAAGRSRLVEPLPPRAIIAEPES
jgi:hypothetical protein